MRHCVACIVSPLITCLGCLFSVGPLVPVGSRAPRGASTSGLSTRSSGGGLSPHGGAWKPHLGAGFPLRCFQRLSLPNGTCSSPRMRRADIEVPNHAVDMDSWARSACYPRGTFYPLSDHAPTCHGRITSSCFRTCSTRRSHSQAPLYTCTRHLITNQAEGTFERLRYILGGNRPS